MGYFFVYKDLLFFFIVSESCFPLALVICSENYGSCVRHVYSNILWAAVILKSYVRYQCRSGLYYSIFFAFSSSSFLCQLLSLFLFFFFFLYSFKGSGNSLSLLAKSIKAGFPQSLPFDFDINWAASFKVFKTKMVVLW